ncbi:threonine ammonia-lyase, biosynthetic [Sessilibacter sp. MAH2]
MLDSYIKRILDARIYDLAVETPLDYAKSISRRLNNSIYIKREDLQPVFSFKIRGAYNKLLKLSESEKAKGVVAASAGNHAQGLAYSAQHLGVSATIVMPKTTPAIKVNAVRGFGANVILHGDMFDEASRYAQNLVKEKGYTYIPPYDDPDVIAGQGTVAMEILRQHPKHIDAIFVPVGGGGLAAGVVAYIKYVRPNIKVFAVEPEDAACLKLAMEAGRREVLSEVGIFADGVAVAQIGEAPFEVLKDTIDGVITANTDEICAAIKDIFEDTRSIAEPAGALSLAGLKKYVEQNGAKDKTLIAIDSGANTNFDRLRYISERTEIGERREAIIAVEIPEKPGAYAQFCSDLGQRNITEFNYRFTTSDKAHIFVGIQVSHGGNGRQELVDELAQKGYKVVDLTDNEVAKLHIRYMVGGHRPIVEGKPLTERVYRFQFPERPGALLKFLKHLAGRWNISMFHYRNHGSAFARILVAMQIPENEIETAEAFLRSLDGYRLWDETDNEAYRLFLA